MSGQPGLQACDLALAEARNTAYPTGVASVVLFRVGGDQVRDPQAACDRRGDERVGRGDDHQSVAGLAVPIDQLFGGRRDQRLDLFTHEAGVPGVELRAWMFAEWLQRERQKLHDVQAAFAVFPVESLVLALVALRIDHAEFAEESTPQVVGVSSEQRIVEVKDCERHALSPRRPVPRTGDYTVIPL